MAFSSAITQRPIAMGNQRISYGSWDATGVTGGDIDTGLRKCHSLMLTHKGSAVEAAVAVVNETYPCDGSAVTIVCTSGDAGYWQAVGY